MGIDVKQFRDEIVVPTLEYIGHYSDDAVYLLLGTAAQESQFRYLRQFNSGPARGLYQCEIATHHDIWVNYLEYRPDLLIKVRGLASQQAFLADHDRELMWNNAYATAICRVHYMRESRPLPLHTDVEGMADYYLEFYNRGGKATKDQFLRNYRDHVEPIL